MSDGRPTPASAEEIEDWVRAGRRIADTARPDVRARALHGVAVAFAESVQFTAAERCAAFDEGVTLREAVNVLAQLERHTSTARYVDNKQAGFTDPDDYQALVNRAQLGDETTVALTLTAFQLEQCSAIVDAYARGHTGYRDAVRDVSTFFTFVAMDARMPGVTGLGARQEAWQRVAAWPFPPIGAPRDQPQ